MKGFLFFTGSLLRWPAKQPRLFLYMHLYILILRFFDYFIGSYSVNGLGLIFTVSVLWPLFLAIFRGLPVDCLDYKAAIAREFISET